MAPQIARGNSKAGKDELADYKQKKW